ncbi:MAG: hypothetical protein ACKO3C_02990, partial [Betaproteobacteria bacterium]
VKQGALFSKGVWVLRGKFVVFPSILVVFRQQLPVVPWEADAHSAPPGAPRLAISRNRANRSLATSLQRPTGYPSRARCR